MKAILPILVFFGCTIAIAQNILELNPTNFPVTTPCGFTKYNNKLYYIATNPTYGRELWQTEGIATTNILLKDIGNEYNITQVSAFIDQTPQTSYGKSFEYNGKLYFNANDKYAQNHFRPYVSDGTTLGTEQFDPNASKITSMRFFKEFNGLLYFTAYNLNYGTEIWSTDGTLDGTTLLKDINPGINSSVSLLDPSFTVFNNILYFKADDGVHGLELWSTDGTSAGTSMVLDINSGTNDSSSIGAFLQNSNFLDEHFKVVGDKFYFRAYQANGNTNSTDLYVSDGTAAGTHRIPYTVTGISGTFYFDGQGLTVLNNAIYYYGKKNIPDPIGGGTTTQFGLFTTDGTTNGTILIKDIPAGTYLGDNGWSDNDTTPGSMRVLDGKAYFLSGLQLWRTDGTTDGTVQITNNPTGYFDYQKRLVSQVFEGKFYFVQNAGPVSVQGIYAVSNDNATITFEGKGNTSTSVISSTLNMTALPSELVSFGNSLYFSAGYNNTTASLWRLRNPALETVQFENLNLKMDLFPNPASDNLNIKLSNLIENGIIKIVTITGQTIFENNNIITEELTLDVSSFKRGIYLIQLSDGKNYINTKFIKK